MVDRDTRFLAFVIMSLMGVAIMSQSLVARAAGLITTADGLFLLGFFWVIVSLTATDFVHDRYATGGTPDGE